MKVLFIVYDSYSSVNFFPMGVAYMAAVLRKEGHDVSIYSNDIYHYPPEHLTQYLERNSFDVVGLSFCAGYVQYEQFLRISEAVNKASNRDDFFYIIGGHGPGADPEYFLRKGNVDFVCMGEGEQTILDLCNNEKIFEIKGLAFMIGDKLHLTPSRPLIQDIDSIPFPAWDLFDINHYSLLPYPNKHPNDRLFSVLSSRGCPYHCNFCYRYMDGIRFRKPEMIAEEIRQLHDNYNINFIAFFDELVMYPGKTEPLCDAIKALGLDIRWGCNGRLNFVKPALIQRMKEAGCVFINYGIECYDNKVLETMHKQLTTDVIDKGIKDTLQGGISPGLNMMFGNKGETVETLWKGVDFILRNNDYSQFRTIRPLTPYPGSEIYHDAIKEGKLKDTKDFYENKHKNSDLLTVNFTELSDEDFYAALTMANKILADDYFHHMIKRNDETMNKLYVEKDSSFRGFRQR